MKWIDSFLFNGEEVVKLRLKFLYKAVDKFYITEQVYTHQGDKKDVIFIEKYKDWFTEYLDKIVFIVDDRPYEGTWKSENAIRNYPMSSILKDYPDEPFIVSVCDCDEIPNIFPYMNAKESIYNICLEGPLYMQQDFYYYNLNWFLGSWILPFFLNDIAMKKGITFQECRDKRVVPFRIFQCGWHFSYFMKRSLIRKKIESFAHDEFNSEEYKNMDHIRLCTHEGKDLFKRSETIITKSDRRDFPTEVLEFGDYIYELQSSSSPDL